MFTVTLAFFLLVVAASVGLAMALMHANGTKSGMGLGVLHGVFVVAGLGTLIAGLASSAAPLGWWILVSFLVAASGGAYLFSRQLKDVPWPGWVILAHGGLALATLVVLGLWLFAWDGVGPDRPDGLQTPQGGLQSQVVVEASRTAA